MKSSTPGALCGKGVFQMQPPISGVNFSNNILVTHTLRTLWISRIQFKQNSM